MFEHCFCGKPQSYFSCCKPYIEGTAIPSTAEALMRSRYTAYTQKNADYLLATYHPDTLQKPTKASLMRGFENVKWLSLIILKTESGKSEDEAFVEYIATYTAITPFTAESTIRKKEMGERSRFLKTNDQWYYIDGSTLKKWERNALCYCGSGKKYKYCCMA